MPGTQFSWVLWFYDKAYWLIVGVLLFQLLARPRLAALLGKFSSRQRMKNEARLREAGAKVEQLLSNPNELEGFYRAYERQFLASNRWDSITYLTFGAAVILRVLFRSESTAGGFALSVPGLVLMAALFSTVQANRQWYRFLEYREIARLVKQRTADV